MSKYTQVYNSTPWFVIVHGQSLNQKKSYAIAPGSTMAVRDPQLVWFRRYRFESYGDHGVQIVEVE